MNVREPIMRMAVCLLVGGAALAVGCKSPEPAPAAPDMASPAPQKCVAGCSLTVLTWCDEAGVPHTEDCKATLDNAGKPTTCQYFDDEDDYFCAGDFSGGCGDETVEGRADGLVSIEDIVEQIVGEIDDEHDSDEPPAIVRQADNSFIADARASLDDVRKVIGEEFVTGEAGEDVETLGGYLVSHVGRLPVRGELISGPGNFEIEVLDADPRRVKRLRIALRKERPAPRKERERSRREPAPDQAQPPGGDTPPSSGDGAASQ